MSGNDGNEAYVTCNKRIRREMVLNVSQRKYLSRKLDG